MTDLQNSASNRQAMKLGVTRVALVVAMVFMLVPTAGAQEKESKSEDDKQPKVEMLTGKVLVLDPDGNPVEGASVCCTGWLYARINGGGWMWNPEVHGPLPRLTTNENGIVEMPYPKYLSKDLETSKIRWLVRHPDFVTLRKSRSVKDDPARITLARGFRIAVTAVDGKTNQKIKNDLYAVVEGSNAPWKLAKNGTLVSPMLTKNNTTLRVCQFVEGQPSLFSESIEIEPGDRGRVLIKDIKLSLGTRVEGQLDESVPRPIKNGNVSVSIVRQRLNQPRSWQWAWRDIVPIGEDGSFVFESLPPNEVLQMLPVCDGWVPSKPEKSQLAKFFPHRLKNLNDLSSPQLIELKDLIVKPVLKMEKATSVRITVKTSSGDPIPDAKVQMQPHVSWYDGGSHILGSGYSHREFLIKSRAGGYEWDFSHQFNAATDKNGVAVIKNLPPNALESVGVEHSEFDRPNFPIEVDLKPDVVAELTIKLQRKGTDALGAKNSVEQGQDNDKN